MIVTSLTQFKQMHGIKLKSASLCSEKLLFLNVFLDILTNFSFADKKFRCVSCGRGYSYKENLYRHRKYECGKEPQFYCPLCPHKSKLKSNMHKHVRRHQYKVQLVE